MLRDIVELMESAACDMFYCHLRLDFFLFASPSANYAFTGALEF